MKGFVRSVDISSPIGDTFSSTVTMEVMGVVNPGALMSMNFDEILPGKTIVKCGHCGQWAARKTACVHCGAPVD